MKNDLNLYHRVIFIRHGVRGLKKIEDAETLFPFFGPKHILSLYGHLYSFRMGKYIREEFGVPTLIYPDNDSERTIQTGIAIAKGSSTNKISYFPQEKDPFFTNTYQKQKEDLEWMRERLKAKEEEIWKKREYILQTFPSLILKEETLISEEGKIEGLLPQLNILSQIPSFSILSKISIPSKWNRYQIESIFQIQQELKYPPNNVEVLGSHLLRGICSLLKKERLSVLIGHDCRHLGVLAKKMGKNFEAPDYAPGYIPANSGFIFTQLEDRIQVDLIYMTLDGHFESSEYLTLPLSDEDDLDFLFIERYV